MKAGKEEKEGARRRFERRLSLLAASRSDAAAYAFVVVVVVVRRKKKKQLARAPSERRAGEPLPRCKNQSGSPQPAALSRAALGVQQLLA